MARILLGVSGGIAAYKSLEFARLATVAGPRRARSDDRERRPLRRRRLLRGDRRRPGAGLRVRARPAARILPGEPPPEHDPIGHLELAANCDAYLVAPASANTVAKLAAGAADSMLTTSFLACAAPRLVAPAMNDRMLRRPRDPGEPRDPAGARGRGDRARGGTAGLPGRAWPWPARPGPPAVPGRIAAAPVAAGPGTASRCWSRPAAPGSRSTPCASSATAPAAAWGSPWPPPRRAAAPTSR